MIAGKYLDEENYSTLVFSCIYLYWGKSYLISGGGGGGEYMSVIEINQYHCICFVLSLFSADNNLFL